MKGGKKGRDKKNEEHLSLARAVELTLSNLHP